MNAAGWPMPDADPQASRRALVRGPAKGTLLWSWRGLNNLAEPVVGADGTIFVTEWVFGDDHALTLLSPSGKELRRSPSADSLCVPILLADGGGITAERHTLRRFSATGDTLWSRDQEDAPMHLRGTPDGEGVCFFGPKAGFTCVGTDGEPGWSRKQAYAWLWGVFAFDRAGGLYTAEHDTWRSSDDDAEHFSRVAAFGADGKPRWSRQLTSPSAYDEPENTVRHIWGLEKGAVFFGYPRIQCYGPGDRPDWEIAINAISGFEKLVEVRAHGLVLGWDRRLSGAPLVADLSGGFREYRPCVTDADGNVYFTHGRRVLALDSRFGLRWAVELTEEPLRDPVIGHAGVLLVTGGRTLFAIG
jgi:outer membrane protein assembly factor BamB